MALYESMDVAFMFSLETLEFTLDTVKAAGLFLEKVVFLFDRFHHIFDSLLLVPIDVV